MAFSFFNFSFFWVGVYVQCVYVVFMWCMHTYVCTGETGPHTEPGAHGLDEAAELVRSKDPTVSASGELGL